MKQIALTMILALGCLAETAQAQDVKAAIRKHYAAAKAYVEQQREVEVGGTFETIYQGKTVPAAYNDSYESRLSAAKGIMELFKTINANKEL